MNKKPKWRDNEGNLYTDSEVVRLTDGKVYVRASMTDLAHPEKFTPVESVNKKKK